MEIKEQFYVTSKMEKTVGKFKVCRKQTPDKLNNCLLNRFG